MLLKKITRKTYCTMEELTQHFKLSRETIRKELLPLEASGLIIREHGKIRYKNTRENAEVLESLGVLSKAQRHHRILQLLGENNEMRITTLAGKLKVSVITLRNDLATLELEGKVIRKHGSAALFVSSVGTLEGPDREIPARIKILGQHTIMHISPGERIFLDSGEVSQFVASSVPPYSNIMILTNSMQTLEVLQSRNYAYPVMTTGCSVSIQERRFRLVQSKELDKSVEIDKAFICCSSYAAHTFFLDNGDDIATIEAVCRRAKRIYIILDSKFLDLQGNNPFDHRKFLSKVQEVLIDDGIGSFRANILFARQDPLVICGHDFTYRNAGQQQHRIGFLVNKDRNYFVQAVHNSLLDAIRACNSISLVIRECNGDYTSTVDNFNILLDERVDLIIDYSLCMESLMYIGEKCLERNIRLISVDYMAPGAIYFGANNATAGRIAGEHAAAYIKEHWDGKLEQLLVLGKYGHEPITKLRISSALEFIGSQIEMNHNALHMIEWGHPTNNPTQELVKLLKDIPKEDHMLIMAFNLRHLLASYDLILQYREGKNTIIVGQNHTRQIEELMKLRDSPIIGCVHYNPEGYGERIMDLALRMLNNADVNPLNYTNLTWLERQHE